MGELPFDPAAGPPVPQALPPRLLAMDSTLNRKPGDSYQAYRNQDHFTHPEFFSGDKNIYINRHTRFLEGPAHDHTYIELCYCLKGSVDQLFYHPGSREEVRLTAGDLVIIPPGMKHQILPIGAGDTLINIVINEATFLQAFLGDIPGDNPLHRFFSETLLSTQHSAFLLFHPPGRSRLDEKLADLILSYIEEDQISQRMCDHYLRIFFLQLLREGEGLRLSTRLGQGGARMAEILLYIRENACRLTLSEAADHFHYSKTYLNRIFREYTGTTVQHYIIRTRLEQAAWLLTATGLSVDDIADRAGYADTSYFIELFRKQYGKTPLQYRRNRQ